jgi:hypothetical protein
MRSIAFRTLLVGLVLALLVPARLHALVAIPAGNGHDVALSGAHHHDHGAHHAPESPQPHEHERQASHAQCLTACLVIPVPQAIFQAPPDVFRRVTGLAVTCWAESLAPPPLERPPRAFS